MSLLIVCPVILPPRAEVLDSWTHRPHLCVINGHHDEWEQVCEERGLLALRSPGNAGCPKSWNLGFEIAQEGGIDHVAIMSQSLVLDPPGTAHLAELVDACADDRGLVTDWSFHAVVFSVALWERVGPFDEGLPIFCDIDYLQRLHDAGERTPTNPMPALPVPGETTRAATITAGLIPPDSYDVDRQRYVAKWGAEPVDPCATPPPPADGPTVADLSLEDLRGTAHAQVSLLGNFAREEDFDGEPCASARWTAYVPGRHVLALTSGECDWIEQAAAEETSNFAINATYVARIPETEEGQRIVDRVVLAARVANSEWWGFELNVARHVQVIRYVPGDDFKAHTDASPMFPHRKLSVIVALSDPDEYEGGRLEMLHGDEPTCPPLERGTIIVLPAYLLHRVTPVTAGQRKMLTMFLEGIPFR